MSRLSRNLQERWTELRRHGDEPTSPPALDQPLWRIGWATAFGVAVVISLAYLASFYFGAGGRRLFIDSHIYFRATEAWLGGANPWALTYEGIPLAAPPPALLLNVPFLPFGEDVAVAFWVLANTASVTFLVRRLQIPWWVILTMPVTEGWLAGSPDLTLAALAVTAVAWIAVLTKPYAAPAVLVTSVRPLIVAGLVGLVTVPLLPWVQYIESLSLVQSAFEAFAPRPPGAIGVPVLLPMVALALLALGWRRGLTLMTPALVGQQPHYAVFSLRSSNWSRILPIAFTIPLPGAAAVGVIGFAVEDLVRRRRNPGKRDGHLQASA